ncbi:MAG: hypothetical protein NTW74_13130 [Acidobacteria bacterium]|nr:hypothetical protein [Acidobacteriota bacterium]
MIWNSIQGASLRSLCFLLALFFATGEIGRTQPVLTKIQDMVYLADGSRFNGLAFIDWKSFDTANGSVIGRNSKVVRIVDGLLQVQLAPTTNTNNTYYSVKYSNAGRVLFTETWAVSPSSATLKIRDVRAVLLPGGFVSAPNTSGGDNSGGGGGVIGENGTGAFVDFETPAGLINGSNLVFTLAAAPNPLASLELNRNGLRLSPSVDFTITGNTITFVSGAQPQVGDILRATYRTGIFGTAPHNLLSSLHTDTFAETVVRGDLLVGQGTTAKWMRLPLGAANRCLTSNGQDAVWNTCLFTGFTTGAVPFVNSTSILTQDSASFFWDATNKRLGLGTSSPAANLTIRASGSQGSTDLTRWVNAAGSTLASVSSGGTLVVQKMNVSSNAQFAALNDSGFGADPQFPASGDFWFNNSHRARKTFEAGQVHPITQVLCSVGGGATSSTTNVVVGSCSIPQTFFDSGDRIEISLNFEHAGSASAFTTEIFVGATSVFSRQFASTDTLAFVRASGGYYPTGVAFGNHSFGTAGSSAGSAMAGLSSNVTLTPTTAVQITFRARLATASSDVVTLRNYTVVRFPAQFNP